MSAKINYSNKTINKSSSNLVIFSNEKFNINGIKKTYQTFEYSYISDLLKTSDLKKNILVFELNSKKNNFNINKKT